MKLQPILSQLRNVKQTGPNQWQACCPAHEDNNPSLCISIGRTGQPLFYCQAGCSFEAVRDALGLTRVNGKAVVAEYDYVNEHGELLYQKVRYAPKEFRQRRPDGHGDWLWNLNGVRHVLYRLLDVRKAIDAGETLYIVEGEKDADRLHHVGLVATTNAEGAAKDGQKPKWRKEYTEQLRGAQQVMLLPDNDGAGRAHMQAVAKVLTGVVPDVRLVELPGVPDKGDISDWLNAGHTVDDLERVVKAAAVQRTTSLEPAPPPELDPYRGTDEANAAFFLSLHGEDIRYCPPWDKWLLWTGSHWQIDDRMDVARMAGNLPRALYRLAGESTDPVQRGTLAALARALENRRKQNDLIASARCRVVVHHSDLDKGRFLLNAANGTINLISGDVREYRRLDLLTHDTGIRYTLNATAPTWERFLNEVFAGDEALIAFVQRAVGYSLTGDVREQILLICYGVGSNGKSVFLNIVRKLLGKLALQAAPDLLMADRNRRHPTEQADLFGKRLVVCQETAEGRRFNEALVKQLTGGDAITARRMNEDFWTFEPTHKLWLSTNHRPEIRGTDYAIWRRIRLIPFNVQFTEDGEHRKDPDMETKLTAELPGILAWAVRGCLDWQREGLRAPEAVKVATEGYRADMDVLAAWIADCCIVKRLADAKASDLYRSYVEWCEQSGERPEAQRSWGMRLSERGFKRERRMVGHCWLGIGLLARDPNDPNDPNDPEMAIKSAQLVHEGFKAKSGSYRSYGSCLPSESTKTKDGESQASDTEQPVASNSKDSGKVRI